MISNGIDIEDISRFSDKNLEKDKHFLDKIFTENELEYCFKFKHPASHLCARFCAKEATVKAFSNIYPKLIEYSKVEVCKNPNGSVYLNIQIDELKKYNTSLSISHDRTKAIASVIVEY